MSELLLCLSHRMLASRPLVTTKQFLAQVLKLQILMKNVTYTSTLGIHTFSCIFVYWHLSTALVKQHSLLLLFHTKTIHTSNYISSAFLTWRINAIINMGSKTTHHRGIGFSVGLVLISAPWKLNFTFSGSEQYMMLPYMDPRDPST
jgi:hypothetical protein